MNLSFQDRIALYILQKGPLSSLSEIAMQGLVEGYESPSLLLLAGLDTEPNPFIAQAQLKGVIEELSLELSSTEDAVFFLLTSVINKIILNQVDTGRGCEFIFEQLLAITDLRKKDDKFVYDSIGLETVYSLYVTIGDLSNATIKWDKLKTNQQLIDETKEKLKEELEKWITSRR